MEARLTTKLLASLALTLTLPQVVFAQDHHAFSVANSISLWIAIVVGLVASLMVLRNARRIGGGVLGSVYNYFGIGMLLIVVGFIAEVIPAWAPPFVVGRVHDILFIIGYAVIAIGAKKIVTASGLK